MPKNSQLPVTKLELDLKNFRTLPQKTEKDAIKAMIAISPDRFYAVLDSIIEDGYIPTENIIVLEEDTKYIVKEGNRRIACLKILQGHYAVNDFIIPSYLLDKIKLLSAIWKKENSILPCIVFSKTEITKCDRVVSLTHGKGEKANREKWSSVATARHNRDIKGASEPALNLLEKYILQGNNLTNQQKERWAGDYPLSVLSEAIRVVYARLSFNNVTDLVNAYPNITNNTGLEDLLRDIGLEQVTFKIIRDVNTDFALNYSIKPIPQPNSSASNQTNTSSSNQSNNKQTTNTTQNAASTNQPAQANNTNTTNTTNTSTAQPTQQLPPAPPAYALNDPRRVTNMLKKFNPSGNRDKVVTLRDELRNINIKKNPIAFCFILRSMFEISAKAYCIDNSLPTDKTKKGHTIDKTLIELLTQVTTHLTSNNTNTAIVKNLHGALTQLTLPSGFLSVTSMNNLVHNPSFSVTASDISILFSQVYPLLEYMN